MQCHVHKLRMGTQSIQPVLSHAEPGNEAVLIARLQSYAAGKPDTLGAISVDFGRMSEFRRRVLTLCRRIPYGHTVSYAKLAAQAGSPHAARAVGHCMAANPIPLLIPCHRVICADGRIGAYSAPGGTAMKERLLAMEQKRGLPHN